ncbi:unnamed protein product [Auanema sp. JU1783]|nr:unnamed protein product [Auanema sp. JU1783]
MPEEGSASPWLDDEDFAGSGNGSGDEPIDDDVDVIVTARPANFLTSAGPTSPAYNRNQMGVTETPGGSSSLSIYVTSILILLISRQIL